MQPTNMQSLGSVHLWYMNAAQHIYYPRPESEAYSNDRDYPQFNMFQRYTNALNVTAVYLDLKEYQIDLKSKDHQHLLSLALRINEIQNINSLSPSDAQIVIAYKDIESNLYKRMTNPAANIVETVSLGTDISFICADRKTKMMIYAARLFLQNAFPKPDPITLADLKRAYPNGIPIEHRIELLGRDLNLEASNYIQRETQIEIRNDRVHNGNVQASARGEELKQASHVQSQMSAPSEGQTQNSSRANNSENTANSTVTREASIARIAFWMAGECSKVIATYFTLKSADKKYEAETKRLLKAIDKINEHLSLPVNIDTFAHKTPQEIADFYLRQQGSNSLFEEAKTIYQITTDFNEESSRQIRELNQCLKNNEHYQEQAGSIRLLNARIIGHYGEKVSGLISESGFLGALQGATSLAAAVALPHSFIASTAATIASNALNIGGERIHNRIDKSNSLLHTQLDYMERAAESLRYNSQQNQAKCLSIQENLKDNVIWLMANRQLVEPKHYREGLARSIPVLQNTMARQEKELEDTKYWLDGNESTLENLQIELNNTKPKHEETRISIGIKMNLCREAIQIFKEQIRTLPEEIDQYKKLISEAEKKLKLAESESALDDARAEILKKQRENAPDERTASARQTFMALSSSQRKEREEDFDRRRLVYGSLPQVAEGLRYFLQGLNIHPIYKNAPEVLNIVQNFDNFLNYKNTIEAFLKNCKSDGTDYTSPTELLQKKGKDNLLGELIIPSLAGSGSLLMVLRSLHLLYVLHGKYQSNAPNRTEREIAESIETEVNKHTKLLSEHLQLITNQNETHFQELKESARTILAHITKKNDEIIAHLDEDRFFLYEKEMNKLKWEIDKVGELLKLPVLLEQIKDEFHNGVRVLRGFDEHLDSVVMSPAYYSGYLMKRRTAGLTDVDASNLMLFIALMTQALKLKNQTKQTPQDKIAVLISFIEGALSEIRKFYTLLSFPDRMVEKALNSRATLFDSLTRNVAQRRVPQVDTCKLREGLNSDENIIALSKRERVGWNKFYLNKVLHQKRYTLKAEDIRDCRSRRHNNDMEPDHWGMERAIYWKKQDYSGPFGLSDIQDFIFLPKIGANTIQTTILKDYPPPTEATTSISVQCLCDVDPGHVWTVERVLPNIIETVEDSTPSKTTTASKKVLLNVSLHGKEYERMHCFDDNEGLSIHASTENSYLSVNDLPNVSSEYPVDEQAYNDKVEQMQSVYLAELAVAPRNSQVLALPSKAGNLTPLIFPKKLIDALGQRLNMQSQVQALAIGTILPVSYDFKYSERSKKFELTIQFSMEYLDAKRPSKNLCEFVVAEFDRDTVDAFRNIKSYTKKEKGFFGSTYETQMDFDEITEPNYQEFLIQAMSCGQHGLGLPGKGTYRTQSGELVSAVERAFPGLYPLFEKYPDHMKSYNSHKNGGKVLKAVGDFVINGDVESFKDDENYTRLPFRVTYTPEAFFSLNAEIITKLDQLKETDEYKAYKNDYQQLQAQIQIAHQLNEDMLKKNMHDLLRLPDPKDISLIYSEWELLGLNPPVQKREFEDACGGSAVQDELVGLQLKLLEWKDELKA